MSIMKRLIEVYDRAIFIGGRVFQSLTTRLKYTLYYIYTIGIIEMSGRGGASVVILKSTMMSTTGVCRCKGYKFGY